MSSLRSRRSISSLVTAGLLVGGLSVATSAYEPEPARTPVDTVVAVSVNPPERERLPFDTAAVDTFDPVEHLPVEAANDLVAERGDAEAAADATVGSAATDDGPDAADDAEAADASDTSDADGAGDDADAADAEPVYRTDDGEEIDAERIASYLGARGAPLAEHADTLVAAGVEHDVDPRLVVAIALAESNGGERLPAGTYNAWGWAGNGPHGLKAWSSWEESIPAFTAGLAENYDVDHVDESFAQTYVPPNWRWWLDTVRAVMAEI
ncbi:MAG: hypothetical protein ACLFRD_11340 [Nitriliruptoraceae bacterium]